MLHPDTEMYVHACIGLSENLCISLSMRTDLIQPVEDLLCTGRVG